LQGALLSTLFVIGVFSLAVAGCGDRTAQRSGESQVEWGERLFAHLGCPTCHSLSGAILQGPPVGQEWQGMVQLRSGKTVIRDEQYIRESIVAPMAKVREGFFPVMVPYADLGEGQLDALVAFLRSRSFDANSN